MSAGTLVVKIAANITDFSRGLDAAEKRLMKAGERLERLGQNLSLKVTAPLLAAGALLAKSAAEDAASVEKMGRVFGKSQASMESFVQSLMKSVPATDDALRGMASSTGTLLANMGLAPAKASAMSQTVLKLAGDFGAFNKELGVAGAADALDSALLGKTKGLAQFGVAVSEADIKAKAYQMGLATVGGELSHAATAQAALAAVLERSQKIQGEAARTIGDNANAVARLKQAADGVGDSFGAVVLPAFVSVTNAAKTMADRLAELPTSARGAIVGIAAVAAAAGPLLYVGGSVVKVVTLMRAGFLALVSVQALSGLGALGASVRSLSEALTVARIAGAALVTALGPLLIASAVVAAIAAIGYAIWKSGESARTAAANLDAYRQKLASFSTATEAQASARGLAAQIGALDARPVARTGDPMQDAMAQVERDRQRQALTDQLRAANQRTFALSTPEHPSVTVPGGSGAGAGKPFAELEAQAARLAKTYELTNAEGRPLVGLTGEITKTMDALSAALGTQANQWGDVAVRIREALAALSKVGQTSKQIELQKLITLTPTGNTIPSASAPLANITAANVSVPPAPPELLKQVALQEAMVSHLAALPGEFASQLGNYLGPVLAKLGGGAGGAIGASVGGAVGKAVGGAIAQSIIGPATGKIAGAILGSAIPVVGTIIGSLAGGFIGSSIGKLFGGKHDKAAEEAAARLQALADAAKKVQEAIAGLPQGIKIAAYRFGATTPVDQGPPGSSAGGGLGSPSDYTRDPQGSQSRGTVFTGAITINGVTDVPGFFRQLSQYAETQRMRGGTSGLQLATS